jgi:hypothetical protein
MKKLSIIGRGTAGCMALAHFLRWTDWEIDFYYDPDIKQQAVGEGTRVNVLISLYENIGFEYSDIDKVDATFKTGILKSGWSKGHEFFHAFTPPFVAYHFNAVKLQDYIINMFKDNSRVHIKETHVESNKLDSNFIMDCSGKSKDIDLFNEIDSIPVNAVYVTQCYWDSPKFNYSLTLARPYGWVFGIPLKNRCSIGYLYNHEISSLAEVQEDVKNIFKQYSLTPSQDTNNFKFTSYKRKNNYVGNVAYNGNASFFYEPLEATSISFMDDINRAAFDLWTGNKSLEAQHNGYQRSLNEIENMIMLHYFNGSIWDNAFWTHAKRNSEKNMLDALKNPIFKQMVVDYLPNYRPSTSVLDNEYGSWNARNFYFHFKEFGIIDKLRGLL